jgi:hypothetical protein
VDKNSLKPEIQGRDVVKLWQTYQRLEPRVLVRKNPGSQSRIAAQRGQP